jgi:hypothetical protein
VTDFTGNSWYHSASRKFEVVVTNNSIWIIVGDINSLAFGVPSSTDIIRSDHSCTAILMGLNTPVLEHDVVSHQQQLNTDAGYIYTISVLSRSEE